MNVLLLTSHLNTGGISRYVINLAKGLSQENRVFVASSAGEWIEKLKAAGAEHIYVPLDTKSIISFKILKSFFILKKFISSNRIDIVHASTRVSQCLAFLLWKFLKVPYVSTFHGYYRPHIFRKLLKFQGLKTISISNEVKNHLCSDLGFDSGNIEVIYNGIEPLSRKSDFSREEALAGFNLKGFPLIGIVARLSAEKNHTLLIKGFLRILADFPDAKLIIAGNGKMKSFLANLVRNMKLSGAVVFLGDADGRRVMSVLDVFVMPSLKEGFGFSVIEAQGLGVPVVVSSAGGLSEIVDDGITGIILKNNDPDELAAGLKKILSDASFRENLKASAKKKIEEKFSLGTMANKTQDVYRSILKKR